MERPIYHSNTTLEKNVKNSIHQQHKSLRLSHQNIFEDQDDIQTARQ